VQARQSALANQLAIDEEHRSSGSTIFRPSNLHEMTIAKGFGSFSSVLINNQENFKQKTFSTMKNS
jgi:hypothetical protein